MKTGGKTPRVSNTMFIDEVKKRRLLWDPSDEEYMDREATAAAWQEIADKMTLAGIELQGDVKLKWKCLRDTYRRIMRSGRPQEETRSRWPYYRRLHFLQQVPIKTRKSAGREPIHREEITDVEYLEEADEDAPPCEYIKCEDSDNEPTVPFDVEVETLDKSEDYDMMFLKSLVPYLKSLEPLRQLIVRNRIQDILLNELAAQRTQKKANDL